MIGIVGFSLVRKTGVFEGSLNKSVLCKEISEIWAFCEIVVVRGSASRLYFYVIVQETGSDKYHWQDKGPP